MKYRVVESYYRQEHLDFYLRYRSPFWAVTVDFDVTAVRDLARARGYPIYLNLCYFFVKAIQGLEDFRYRLLDGEVVLYEALHPGMTVPAPDGRFSFLYLDYDPDTERFNREAAPKLEAASERVALAESRHRNYVFFTALPGVPFTSFVHASDDPGDGAPRVAFGRFSERAERAGRTVAPVGIQVNHAFIDGTMMGELVERVQALYDDPR